MKKIHTFAVLALVLTGLTVYLWDTVPRFRSVVLSAWAQMAPPDMPRLTTALSVENRPMLFATLGGLVLVGMFAWLFIQPDVKSKGRIPRKQRV
jgi:hypothetical protein